MLTLIIMDMSLNCQRRFNMETTKKTGNSHHSLGYLQTPVSTVLVLICFGKEMFSFHRRRKKKKEKEKEKEKEDLCFLRAGRTTESLHNFMESPRDKEKETSIEILPVENAQIPERVEDIVFSCDDFDAVLKTVSFEMISKRSGPLGRK